MWRKTPSMGYPLTPPHTHKEINIKPVNKKECIGGNVGGRVTESRVGWEDLCYRLQVLTDDILNL